MEVSVVAIRVVVAVVGAPAFVAGQRGADDERTDGVQAAKFNGFAGLCNRHGGGDVFEVYRCAFKTLAVAEQSRFIPHGVLNGCGQIGC